MNNLRVWQGVVIGMVSGLLAGHLSHHFLGFFLLDLFLIAIGWLVLLGIESLSKSKDRS